MLDLVEAMQDGGKPLAACNSIEALHGFALAIDLGAIDEFERRDQLPSGFRPLQLGVGPGPARIPGGPFPVDLASLRNGDRFVPGVETAGGFNQGCLTLGVGAKLLFLDLNAAFFTREMGKYIGDRPNSGMSLEAAIRF
jgi:hypothetical protein